MIDLSFLSPNVPTTSPADLMPSTFTNSNSSASVLTSSRRPAILTYASPIIDTASTLSGLPWYVMGWKKESEVLEVSMFEGVKFSKGWRNVPDRVIVVVEADEKMQFYDVVVKIVARFGGLRYELPILSSSRSDHALIWFIQVHTLQLPRALLPLLYHNLLHRLPHHDLTRLPDPLILHPNSLRNHKVRTKSPHQNRTLSLRHRTIQPPFNLRPLRHIPHLPYPRPPNAPPFLQPPRRAQDRRRGQSAYQRGRRD